MPRAGALTVPTVQDGGGVSNLVPGIAPVQTLTLTASSTSMTTNDATWDVWNQVYYVTNQYVNSAATAATAYQVQAHLNAVAMEMTMTGNTWGAWNVTYAANTIATAVTTNTTNTITLNATWDDWNQVYAIEEANRENQVRRQIAAGRQPSAEQQEKWRQEEIARRDAEAKRLREELAAKDKAIVLLKSCLTPQQIEEYEQKSCFHLHVGGKVYRIEKGSHGNVKLVDKDGRVKRSFCVQPRGVPEGDAMLAQKLLLESDERRFYELSNVTEYENGQHVRTLHAPRGAELLREIAQQSAG
jgi:hypothetical protein